MHACRLRRAAKTGAWHKVLPSTVNGTELGSQEWRDVLFLRYGLDPPDLPTYCDGCQAKFLISQALDCKKFGLVIARHNKLHDGVADLLARPTHPLTCTTTSSYTQVAPRRGQRLRQPSQTATVGIHQHQRSRTEGRSFYPRPLATGYRQCSRHVCHEQ